MDKCVSDSVVSRLIKTVSCNRKFYASQYKKHFLLQDDRLIVQRLLF